MSIYCNGCNRNLPATSEYFHKKSSKTGYASRCKDCIKEYYKRYYNEKNEELKNRKAEQSKSYYDRNREEIISRRRQQYKGENSVRKAWTDKYYELNRQMIKDKTKAYAQTEIGKEKHGIYQQNRRAIGKDLPSNFSAKQWKECKLYFDNKCAYCGEEKPLTKDHFLALKYGGEYTKNNIIPSCKPCNSKKRADNFFNWYQKQKFYSKQREQKILKYLNYKENMQQLALL